MVAFEAPVSPSTRPLKTMLSLPIPRTLFDSQMGKGLLQRRFELGYTLFELGDGVWSREREVETGRRRRAKVKGSHGGGYRGGTTDVPRLVDRLVKDFSLKADWVEGRRRSPNHRS